METILGIRISSTHIRYAILQCDAQSTRCINKDTEHKLVFPANFSDVTQKIHWIDGELKRILNIHQDISKIALKVNEYSRGSLKKSARETINMEGAIILTAQQSSIPIKMILYANMRPKQNSRSIKEQAELLTGRTNRYWDEKIADAIVAAFTIKN